MNIHIVHLPVLLSLASQIRMCAPRKAKWLTNDNKALEVLKGLQVLKVQPSSPSSSSSHTPLSLKRVGGKEIQGTSLLEVDVLEDDAISDLRPEVPSRRAISVVAWRKSQSISYADHRVTWSLPDHIWPWALAQTSIFSENNTEIKYKLNYSRRT